MHVLSEQEIVRRESLKKIIELGIDPYPAALFPVSNNSAEIKTNYEEVILEDGTKDRKNFHHVVLAGRVMAQREAGKALFMNIQDSAGLIQLYLRREEVIEGKTPEFWDLFIKKYLDIGDIIGVEGFGFKTKTGEVSVHVQKLTLLSKSLRPLPIIKRDVEGNIYDAFTNPELRYRQRYVDLIVNPEVREIFIKKSIYYINHS